MTELAASTFAAESVRVSEFSKNRRVLIHVHNGIGGEAAGLDGQEAAGEDLADMAYEHASFAVAHAERGAVNGVGLSG